jgi:hypothetical protein
VVPVPAAGGALQCYLAAQAAAPSPTPSAPAPGATNPEKAGAVVPVPAAGGALQRYAVAQPLNVEPPGGKTNYVVVVHPMSRKYGAIAATIPGVQEGQVVVLLADGRILPVSKLHLVHAEQFWTQMSYDDGQVFDVTSERPAGEPDLDEHIESVVLCYTPAGVVSARATWRKTRSPFAKVMAKAVREKEGRWQEITGTPVVESRKNRKTEKPYTILTAHIGAINSDEARALNNWASDPVARADFEQVTAAYEKQVRSLREKAR